MTCAEAIADLRTWMRGSAVLLVSKSGALPDAFRRIVISLAASLHLHTKSVTMSGEKSDSEQLVFNTDEQIAVSLT